MLDRANRLVRGDDFRKIMRAGKKQSTSHLVGYRLIEEDQSKKFGAAQILIFSSFPPILRRFAG